ncbi:NAD(P)H-dependent flavin oxidoreductase [Pseudoxanthomonas indica]|uniref:Nitronate monooxygenase n=1 Tax=Pseudoxanthomonas indica TaxID=428993 RepID=A0A1T5LUG4_9GAMM|nr:nitronate monooxygenase [Pseudoxanthomonas indica]GGD39352.1 2-nitropropane dioxygenase [Pseudoxanthomonas indica]SKC79229.1 nitronate monooxygenase [Pseudoxanthomonas indica]
MSLSQLLGTELPLLQAPMAGVQGSRLAAAVSKAGALGALPCAMLGVERIREEVTAIRAQTAHPFNLNFFCHQPPAEDAAREAAWRQRLAPDYARLGVSLDAASSATSRRPFDAQMLALVGELRPAVVSFHFGLPEADLWQPLRALGIRVLASATTLEEGRWLQQQGVDAVIAQGWEAGGHRGMFLGDDLGTQMGTFALLPQLVHALRVPVIAAGGIADADGVAAAMRLGAAGVQVGTAYLLCPEADTSAVHRGALQGAQAAETAVTNVFTGRPARGIVNHAMRAWGPINPDAPAFPLAAQFVAPLRKAAEAQGSSDYSPLWAGQNTSGCRETSAAELTWALAQGLGSQEPPCLV